MPYLIPSESSTVNSPVFIQLVATKPNSGRTVSVTTTSQTIALMPGTRMIKFAVGTGGTIFVRFGSSSITAGSADGAFDDFVVGGFTGWLGVPDGATHMAIVSTTNVTAVMVQA